MADMLMQGGPYPVPQEGDEFTGDDLSTGVPAPEAPEAGGWSDKTWIFLGLLLVVLIAAGIMLYENSKASTTKTATGESTDTTSKQQQQPINIDIIENRPGVPPVGPSPTPAPSTSGSSPPATNPVTVKVSQPPSTGGANFQDTSTGVPILSGDNSSAKLSQLKSSQATSIPGLSSSLVAFDKQKARQGYISGLTNTNVPELSSSTPFSAGESILDSRQGVSIPGLSAASVAYLQNEARRGKLTASEYEAAVRHG